MPEETVEPKTEAAAPAPREAPAAAHPTESRQARKPEAGRRRGAPPVRRKVCRFCAERTVEVDYKQIPVLRAFMTDGGKILSGRMTGNCARHQRQVRRAIKRARNLSLLPYVSY